MRGNSIRCLVLVASVLVARAQPKNERYLNVVASDSKGAPITDLTSADFQIFDDGKVQQITSFQASAKQQSRAAIPTHDFDRLRSAQCHPLTTRVHIYAYRSRP